jgi:hypothetical protein
MVLYNGLRLSVVQSMLNKLDELPKPAFRWHDYKGEVEYKISRKQYNFLLKLYHAGPYENIEKYLIHMGYKLELLAYRLISLEFHVHRRKYEVQGVRKNIPLVRSQRSKQGVQSASPPRSHHRNGYALDQVPTVWQ